MFNFNYLKNELPAFISRRDIPKYFCKSISHRTLANLDSKGKGPKERFMVGNKVMYSRDSIIEFFNNRIRKISNTKVTYCRVYARCA